MGRVHICFGVDSEIPAHTSSVVDQLEKSYNDVYKNAATFFYSHPGCPFFFTFTGHQISYYHKKHPELLKIIHELENRKQAEIVGGGYWNPIFPLLFPSDRSGQIEMLSSAIRTSVGKRPRGTKLYADNWDSNMVSSLQTCGMEYVLLDNSVIPQQKQCFLPLVMCERGKSVDIIPFYNNFKNDILEPKQNIDTKEQRKIICEQIFKDIQKKISKQNQQSEIHMVTILFSIDEFEIILENGMLESFYETANEMQDINISLPTPSRKITSKVPSYIPNCLSDNLAQWATVPYVSTPAAKYQTTIFDFLQTYPQIKALYDRMLYVSMLINQCHGDKMRKNTAREKLWEAQAGDTFVCSPDGVFASSAKRHHVYSLLTEAEQLVREASEFKESMTSLDYNGDGINEYIIRMQNYNACIYPAGGAIRELDIFHNAKNYADNLNRVEKFDTIGDNYWRGLFVDHLFSADDFEKYKKTESAGDGIFSRIKYEETRFSSPRKEVQLVATADFGAKSQRVILRKKYIASSNGFTVQYILKNGSNEAVSAKLVIESNFAEPGFENGASDIYKLQVATDGTKKELLEHEFAENNLHENISALQVIDSDVSFVFEPNENCDVFFAPLTFHRPCYNAKNETEIMKTGKTLCIALLWHIELEPGLETEKTINFGILHSRKEIKRKKTK